MRFARCIFLLLLSLTILSCNRGTDSKVFVTQLEDGSLAWSNGVVSFRLAGNAIYLTDELNPKALNPNPRTLMGAGSAFGLGGSTILWGDSLAFPSGEYICGVQLWTPEKLVLYARYPERALIPGVTSGMDRQITLLADSNFITVQDFHYGNFIRARVAVGASADGGNELSMADGVIECSNAKAGITSELTVMETGEEYSFRQVKGSCFALSDLYPDQEVKYRITIKK